MPHIKKLKITASYEYSKKCPVTTEDTGIAEQTWVTSMLVLKVKTIQRRTYSIRNYQIEIPKELILKKK